MSKFIGVIVGAVELIGGIILVATGVGAALGALLITAGIGTLFSGVGTLLSGVSADSGGGQQIHGFATASRNPIAPWLVIYGRTAVGGTVVHLHEFGESNKYLDMVIVLACHQCESVDGLLFNKQLVQISTDGGSFTGVGGSFTPLQQTVDIVKIVRSEGVVAVIMAAAIPLLDDGYLINIQNVSGDFTLNGKWPVETIVAGAAWSSVLPYVAGNAVTYSGVGYFAISSSTNAQPDISPSDWIVGYGFRYISGGADAIVDNEGQVVTAWPDYGKKVHMEVLLGNHTDTFPGMLLGTGDDNDSTSDHSIVAPNNPWTSAHKLQGKTCVFLRMHYDENIFSGGIPQISFLVHGKNDIYEPRTSPATRSYSENAALCTADYLSHPAWGFKAAYGAEIPIPQLISAANICDESVALASGASEPRYALNGKFDLSAHRGEVLQNLLTACAGRLAYQGGQFIIWPAAWNGTSPSTAPSMGNMSGPFRWKPTSSIRDLYNGVKGTYVSPANNWQASDIPAYAQDEVHGYDSDENLAADGGDRRWLDIQLPFTISAATAQRLCKIELLRRRQPGTGTFRYNMAGYSIATMDVIQKTLPFFSWENKLLEVLAHRFTLDKQSSNGNDVTLLGTEIDVQETDSSIYDWSDTEELTPQGYQQSAVPDARTPAPPTGLTVISNESTLVVTPQGVADSILVTWDAPVDGYVTNGGHIEIRYKLVGDTIWKGLPSVNPSVTQVAINGVVDGSEYEVEIRAVNAGGTPSQWVIDDSVIASGQSAPLPYKPYAEEYRYAPSSYGIGLAQIGGGTGDNSIVIRGTQPVNSLSGTITDAPDIDPFVLVAAHVGSSMPPGDFVAQVFPIDSDGVRGPGSKFVEFTIPGTIGGSTVAYRATLTVALPASTVEYEVFAGRDRNSMFGQGATAAPLTSAIDVDIMDLDRYGPPDTHAVAYHARAKRVIHGGIGVSHVTSRSSSQIEIDMPSAPSADEFAGRDLIILSRAGLPSGATYNVIDILHNDTGSPSCILTVPLTHGLLVEEGDLVMISTLSDASTGDSITDSGLVSPFAPTGFDVDAEIGNQVLILKDPTGAVPAGETRDIVSNTGTALSVRPFSATPGTGTIYIVVEKAWRADVVSTVTTNAVAPTFAAEGDAPLVSIPAVTLSGYVALVQILLQDQYGNDSIEIGDGIRMLYLVPPPPVAVGISTYSW